MANNTKSLDEYLAEKGISGWYVWRPNQLYTKDPSDPDKYISADILTSSMIDDLSNTIEAAADQLVEEINSTGDEKKSEIEDYDMTYFDIKTICLDTFNELASYYRQHGRSVEETIVEQAIDRINNLGK